MSTNKEKLVDQWLDQDPVLASVFGSTEADTNTNAALQTLQQLTPAQQYQAAQIADLVLADPAEFEPDLVIAAQKLDPLLATLPAVAQNQPLVQPALADLVAAVNAGTGVAGTAGTGGYSVLQDATTISFSLTNLEIGLIVAVVLLLILLIIFITLYAVQRTSTTRKLGKGQVQQLLGRVPSQQQFAQPGQFGQQYYAENR